MSSLMTLAVYEDINFSLIPSFLEEINSHGFMSEDTWIDLQKIYLQSWREADDYRCNICRERLFSHGWRMPSNNPDSSISGIQAILECQSNNCKLLRLFFGIPCYLQSHGYDFDIGDTSWRFGTSYRWNAHWVSGDVIERRKKAVGKSKLVNSKTFEVREPMNELVVDALLCEMLRQTARQTARLTA